MEKFDVIIIGAGQAGNPLSQAFANAGKKTALIEEQYVGGTCINFGCCAGYFNHPSKIFESEK